MSKEHILSEVTTKAGKIVILDTWMERRIYPSYIRSVRRCKATCVCGKDFVVNYSALKTGATNSCGCYTRKRHLEMRMESTITTKAGDIVILDTWIKNRENLQEIKGNRFCKATCVCGQDFVVNYSSLKTGKTHSCGCYTKTRNSFLNFKHGQTMYNNIRYKLSPTYKSLIRAKQDCYNKNSKRYKTNGGRGIKVCDEWMDFRNFLRDMGEKPEGYRLNRLDKDGDFEPNNCEWVEISEKKGRIR